MLPKKIESKRETLHPLETASWFSRVFLLWLDPFFRLGATRQLTMDDVWKLSQQDTAKALHNRFEHHWKATSPNFLVAICRTFAFEISLVMTMAVVYSFLAMAQPMLIKSLLNYLEPNEESSLSGYTLASLLSLVTLVSVTILDSSFFITARLATNVKSVAMDAVFLKALRLAKSSVSSGDVLTMLSVDSTRMFVGFTALPWTVVPLITLPLLYISIGYELGWSVGATGGASLLFVMAIGYKYANSAGHLRQDLMTTQAERVKMTNELLQGIRVVKMHGWEAALERRIATVRDRELMLQRHYQFGSEMNAVGLLIAPSFSMAVMLVVFVAQGNTLTPTVVFTLLACMNVARLPCNLFAFAVMRVTEAWTSAYRIGTYIMADDLGPRSLQVNAKPKVQIVHGTFSWSTQIPGEVPTSSVLRDINVSLPPGKLTMIVGPVGSGKSRFISAILGELHQIHGERHVHGRIAYVGQDAWIQHASVRGNILFSEPLDPIHYDHVVSACQLKPDLALLPHGDATEIGERGINLSGGQKARVSIARALYRQDADIFLLDDPLSSLDVHVAGAVFHDGLQGLLHGKTVVLVLNSHYHLLQHADNILIMDQGRIIDHGTFESLSNSFDRLIRLKEPHEPVQAAPKAPEYAPSVSDDTKNSKQLVQNEEQNVGRVTRETYLAYFGASGWHGPTVLTALFGTYAFSQALVVLTDWFMGWWAASSMSKHRDSTSTNMGIVYVALSFLSIILLFGRAVFAMQINLACVRHLHSAILNKVTRAPVNTFFDVTPTGRILNRFSNDLNDIDSRMPTSALYLLQCLFQVAAILVVCGVALPILAVTFYIPFGLVLYTIYRAFSSTSPELSRLASIARTPLLSQVTETLNGLVTIRAFEATATIQSRGREALDNAQGYLLIQFLASRWLQMRMDWLSAIVVAAVAFQCVNSKGSIDVATAGIALTYAAQLSGFLSRAVMGHAEVSEHMTSVERLLQYAALKEESHITRQLTCNPCKSWPRHGRLAFEQYSMRYRDNLDLVLKDVSFTVEAGEKIGICGRTGSGKSSLMVALFRTVDAASGCVRIDNVDIATVDLPTLRSRLTIIPQDPVLFSGTLRFNLDPSDNATAEELQRVLKQVHLMDLIQAQGGLDFQVAERGGNLSSGQRQLVCIARALLRCSRVVVLDEATASIDVESDKLIQATIKANFAGVTTLVIAHRLDTILDSDRILVMDQGRVSEFDTPKNLLAKKDGAFTSLARHAHLLH
ncbi:hypothetical protein AeMF1_021801 [Aphanomyces euteiches]|nr:hypothetical protein AeMF1_021801 [Aphanomyces euteiches]